MASLKIKFGPFRDFDIFNSKVGLYRKSREDNDLENEIKNNYTKIKQVPVASILHNLCLKCVTSPTVIPLAGKMLLHGTTFSYLCNMHLNEVKWLNRVTYNYCHHTELMKSTVSIITMKCMII
jgi:hypothetical protein